ncbi:MAG: glycosyltransferase family 4 protein [Methylophilus sp.]
MNTSKRILLSAFECNPYMGSDAEVGWQWAKQLSMRGYDVTVVTRRTHKLEIEKMIAETNDCENVSFEYVDIEWLYPITELFNPRNHAYYYFWQVKAMWRARQLNKKNSFSLIHHVTWVSFRQPSFMGLIGVPMYFGPVAGGDEIPRGYAKSFGLKRRVVEIFRSFINATVLFDPLMWLTYATADKVFFTSGAHLQRVPEFVRKKAQIELAIGCHFPETEESKTSEKRAGNKLLFVGRFLGLKGMDLGLQIFAKVRQARPDVTLTMIGDGEEKERWQALAKHLGVADAIVWLGWLPKAEVLKLYAQYDVFFFPSLRDSGGFVVLEALEQGMPVACFKLGGPGVLVDDTCGKAVLAEDNIDHTVTEYAQVVINILAKNNQLSQACKQRVKKFTWDNLIKRVYKEL